MSETQGDSVLSELCTICHINPPKYRCPRCFTRTCSLPCTKRHKTWSQCSGVRDPAAYVRRNELATPAAFDRDFNFITGIERRLERAERDAENRGIPIDHIQHEYANGGAGGGAGAGHKRKRPQEHQHLVKGEAGFLRGAERAGVRVVRAPRGMTRNKQNMSRWHPKHKCLSWTVEWIAPDGQKTLRNCLETCTVAEAYDRVYPLPKEEREKEKEKQQDVQDSTPDKTDQVPIIGAPGQLATDPPTISTVSAEEKQDQLPAPEPEPEPKEPQVGNLREEEEQTTPDQQETTTTTAPSSKTATPEPPQPQPESQPQPEPHPGTTTTSAPSNHPSTPISSHRNIYFYLHRPRTTTKQPVLIPLSPAASLTSALRNRTVLEFPTVYVLPYSPGEILSGSGEARERFLLEEEYLRTCNNQAPDEDGDEDEDGEDDDEAEDEKGLANVDETKVLEVLKQDLMGAGSGSGAPTAAAAAVGQQ